MEKVKEILDWIVHGRLIVEGTGRTFVRAPLWLTVLAALSGRRGIRMALLTALLVVAFGMRARVERR